MKSRLAAVAAAAAGLLALAGCGSSGKPAAAPPAPKSPPVIDIKAAGSGDHWSYQLPAGGLPGGVVTLRLTNASTADSHDFQLARVDGHHSAKEVKAATTDDGGPIPAWLHAAGGVASVPPGQAGQATLSLPAGHYFYFCTEDTDGQGHADHGMSGELDVTGDSGTALPAATARVEASEYKFAASGLKAGANLVKFTNNGHELHNVVAWPILPGKTLDDVKAAFASHDDHTPPPVDFSKGIGTAVIDPGQTLVVPWTLSPGHYALICFMTDHDGGPPHFAKGMIQQLDIT